jgi:hypothetical protein
MKEFFAGLMADVVKGMRNEFRFFRALIIAPWLVCKEFITSTGQFAPKRDDSHTDGI